MVSACSPCLQYCTMYRVTARLLDHTPQHRQQPLFPQSRGAYRLVHGETTPILRGEGPAAASRSSCRRRTSSSNMATAAPCAGLGPGIRLTEEARPHVYFACWADGRVSACVYYVRTRTRTHTHTHRDTCDRDKGTTAAPEVGPIKSYMQVRWRGETRSCKATRISFLIFHRPSAWTSHLPST